MSLLLYNILLFSLNNVIYRTLMVQFDHILLKSTNSGLRGKSYLYVLSIVLSNSAPHILLQLVKNTHDSNERQYFLNPYIVQEYSLQEQFLCGQFTLPNRIHGSEYFIFFPKENMCVLALHLQNYGSFKIPCIPNCFCSLPQR